MGSRHPDIWQQSAWNEKTDQYWQPVISGDPDLGMTSAAGFMLAPAFCPMVMVTVPTVRPISSPAGEWPCDMRHELT